MRRERYVSEKNAAEAREAKWRLAALGLVATNVLLAVTIMGTDTTEKTVVVPPTIERSFWVKGAEVSPEYLEEMSRYLSTLVLNATPKSVDANIDVFLRYVDPNAYGAIRSRMAIQAERLRRDDVSTVFYPVAYQTSTEKAQVAVTGDFVTVVGKQIVSSVRRSWRFDFTHTGGRLWVSEFVPADD